MKAHKILSNFFISNPFIFTDYLYSDDYFAISFKKCRYGFRAPSIFDPVKIVNELKDRIVQTIQVSTGEGLLTYTVIQLSVKEHMTVSYHVSDDRLGAFISFHIENPSVIPSLLEFVQKFIIEDEKKVAGFAAFTK